MPEISKLPRLFPRAAPLLLGVLTATVCALACTEEAADGPGAGGATAGKLEPGEACSVDEECRDGLVCNAARRVCTCVSDESCEGDLKCQPITGLCVDDVPGCKQDADCGEGAWCDEASRVCKQLRDFCDPCTVNDECGGTNACVGVGPGAPQGFCGKACTGPADCTMARTRCDAAIGQCVPDTTCEDIEPCNPDSFQTCNADADCTQGTDQFCDVSIGQCLARLSGCGFGLVCNRLTATCEPVCTGDADCQVGQRCINSLCQEIAYCQADADCAQNKVCRVEPGATEGECVATCSRSADCPIGNICVRGDDARLTCRAGCASAADCGPAERCDAQSNTCVGGAGVCQINDVCGTCEVCSANRCVPAGSPYCSPCTGSGLDATCGSGGVCVNGACAPACPAAGCPKGFVCRRFLDGAGNELARGCYPIDGQCPTECN